MKLTIDVGDIFILTDDAYLLVIDVLPGFDDDYGHFPATARVVAAIRGEFYGCDDSFMFRDWGNQALDWVFLDAGSSNLVNQDALAKLERVGQDRDENFIPRVWALLGDFYFGKAVRDRRELDPRLAELSDEASAALNALDNPMGL